MGRRPDLNRPQQREFPRLLDTGPRMTRDEVQRAVRFAERQKGRRANTRLKDNRQDAPFEIWMVFPGNQALEVLHLILVYGPETLPELKAMADYLWTYNLVGGHLAHNRGEGWRNAGSCDQLYDSRAEALDMYRHYMQAMRYLWEVGNGASYAPDGAGARGLSLPYFLELLSYGCADVLFEPRRTYHGVRGWAAIAVVHDVDSHWEVAVRDNDALFRRAIPADDMHSARGEYGEICYELLDRQGEIALWEDLGDGFADLQPLLGQDRFGHYERLHDIRVHVMAPRATYVQMIDPNERYRLCRERWMTANPGELWRPLRHRLFLLDQYDQPAEEVGFYVCEEKGVEVPIEARDVARLAANTPEGLECYGRLPNSVRTYQAPHNGVLARRRCIGRTQADSLAPARPFQEQG